MNDNKIIEKLGGVKLISEILGFPYTTVSNWKTRGIASSVKVKFPQYFMPASLKDVKPLTEADRVKKPQVKSNA